MCVFVCLCACFVCVCVSYSSSPKSEDFVHARKDWRCRAQITPVSSSRRAHVYFCGDAVLVVHPVCDIGEYQVLLLPLRYQYGRYLRFGPTAQCVVHALKGLICRACVAPASLPASHCKQCSALTSPAFHACGCARPSRAR